MILKDECKKLDIEVSYLANEVGIPIRTLQDWAKKHPKRVLAFLDAIRYRKSLVGDSHLQKDLL